MLQIKLENLLRLRNESSTGAFAKISAGQEQLLWKYSRRIFLVKFSDRTNKDVLNLVSQTICDRSDWDDRFYALHLLSSIWNKMKTFVKINNSTPLSVQYSPATSLSSFCKFRKFLSININFCKLLPFHRLNCHKLRVSLTTRTWPTHSIYWFKLGVFLKHLLNLR